MLRLPLRFPAPPGASEPVIWTEEGFHVGGKPIPVLSYSTGPVAWTDELTAVHEEVAGEDHYIDRASREHAAEQLRRWLPDSGSPIMDIGCSSGFLLQLLKQRFPERILVGGDCVRAPLEHLAERMPGIPLLQFDLVDCPLFDQSFDGLVLLNVLEHIEDDLGALRQAHRLLKPGGIAVIEVPAGSDLFDVYDRQLLHFRRYSMPDLLDKVRCAGFTISERSHLGFFLYPGFRIVKKRNQKYLTASPEVQREVVKGNISRSKNSGLMHAIMKIESRLRRHVYFPAGIRCLVTCRRPEP